ncbi:MAG TPA: porphobilinogen synthase [Planctomycetota bacterium]|nr:porphobilinogen synthase [Planctomycetota bacterium]
MSFPLHRPRRLRRSENLRRMVRETELSVDGFVSPIFLCDGKKVRREIRSMPGVFQMSLDVALDEARQLRDLKIPATILFGVPPRNRKDARGSDAWSERGLVQQASALIKKHVPELVVIADTCFCEYTDHGHCGVLDAHRCVINDKTLENLARTAVSQAKAGADIIAPSGMMDGMVAAIRAGLDTAGFSETAIMAYSVKYASAFYGPFRDAADSAPAFGDRRQYQMDYHNALEGEREARLDIDEGADIVMVKPALAYMDLIHRVRSIVDVPVCAYNVSGEYSMVKAAAQKGWLDEKRVVLESLTGLKRAGAGIVITYWAKDVARWLK